LDRPQADESELGRRAVGKFARATRLFAPHFPGVAAVNVSEAIAFD
jgi:hypothetical protein